jgi:phosphatidylinositol alpha-1,6-mannosyltransferase
VLFAVNDFPPLLGGESTLYHGLARHLMAGEAALLAPRLPGDQAFDRDLKVRVFRRRIPEHGGGLSRLARTACALAHLEVLLSTHRYRYLVCGQLLSLGVPVRLLAGLHGLPYAVFVHGADLLDYHDRPPWGRLARWVVEGAETVLVNSRFTGALVESLLPGAARRIVVLPMGVSRPQPPPESQVADLRRRYRLSGGPVLLTVARLVACKGHDVVLRALPRLLQRHPDLRYLIVGGGPQRASLERLAADLGIPGSVVFCGLVPPEELAAHFRLATLFVLLSRATEQYDGLEGFGLAFLEAASHGLPAIGGRSGGVPEAVQEELTGLLVPPLDQEAFAAAVERLLGEQGTRSRMSEAARLWALSHTWERSASVLRSVWSGD